MTLATTLTLESSHFDVATWADSVACLALVPVLGGRRASAGQLGLFVAAKPPVVGQLPHPSPQIEVTTSEESREPVTPNPCEKTRKHTRAQGSTSI